MRDDHAIDLRREVRVAAGVSDAALGVETDLERREQFLPARLDERPERGEARGGRLDVAVAHVPKALPRLACEQRLHLVEVVHLPVAGLAR